jgi:hypothetical protein
VVARDGGDGGWTRWRCFPDASPLLFFSFSSVLFFFFTSSFLFFFFSPPPLRFPSLLLSIPLFSSSSSFSRVLFFFSLVLCFFSLLLYFCSLSPPSSIFFFLPRVFFLPCIYRGKKEVYTPALSMAQGCRVDGAVTVQLPLYHPRDTSPPLMLTRGKLCRWRDPWSASFWVIGGKEVSEKQGRKDLLLPLFRASRGRRRPIVPFKTAPFWPLFFFTVNSR